MKVWKIRRIKDGLYKGKGAAHWNWDEVGHPFMTKGAALSNVAHSQPGLDECEWVEFELKEVLSGPVISKVIK